MASGGKFESALLALSLPLLSSLQIGALITWGLQGVLQLLFKLSQGSNIHESASYFSIILELLQTLLVTHDTYDIFVKGFGDIADLDDLRFLWFTLPILGGTDHGGLITSMWNGSGAICDIAIAGYMTYYVAKRLNSTASISSAVLFVGFRQRITISVYFIVPAIMITKLNVNNRPHAVGGPPPLTDIETCFDDSLIPSITLPRAIWRTRGRKSASAVLLCSRCVKMKVVSRSETMMQTQLERSRRH
ncbi:hypothetical protein BJ912DRAFT_929327 [Pholiota molesta]|nr:hypothetical protein BJ912DRAFT_929327 [Pholiota molesta]